jgi:hypothetical protein
MFSGTWLASGVPLLTFNFDVQDPMIHLFLFVFMRVLIGDGTETSVIYKRGKIRLIDFDWLWWFLLFQFFQQQKWLEIPITWSAYYFQSTLDLSWFILHCN